MTWSWQTQTSPTPGNMEQAILRGSATAWRGIFENSICQDWALCWGIFRRVDRILNKQRFSIAAGLQGASHPDWPWEGRTLRCFLPKTSWRSSSHPPARPPVQVLHQTRLRLSWLGSTRLIALELRDHDCPLQEATHQRGSRWLDWSHKRKSGIPPSYLFLSLLVRASCALERAPRAPAFSSSNFSFSSLIVPVRSEVRLAWKEYNLNLNTVACCRAIIERDMTWVAILWQSSRKSFTASIQFLSWCAFGVFILLTSKCKSQEGDKPFRNVIPLINEGEYVFIIFSLESHENNLGFFYFHHFKMIMIMFLLHLILSLTCF